jgi:hypothetical protein
MISNQSNQSNPFNPSVPSILSTIYELTYGPLIVNQRTHSYQLPFKIPMNSVIISHDPFNIVPDSWNFYRILFYGVTEGYILSTIEEIVQTVGHITFDYSRTLKNVSIGWHIPDSYSVSLRFSLCMYEDIKDILMDLSYSCQSVVDDNYIYWTNKYELAWEKYINISRPIDIFQTDEEYGSDESSLDICVSGVLKERPYNEQYHNLSFCLGASEFYARSENESLKISTLAELYIRWVENPKPLQTLMKVSTWEELTDVYKKIPVTLAPPIKTIKVNTIEGYETYCPLWDLNVHKVVPVDYVYVSFGLDVLPWELKADIMRMMSVLRLEELVISKASALYDYNKSHTDYDTSDLFLCVSDREESWGDSH